MGLWSLESWFESRPRNHFFVGFPVPLPRRGGSHGLLLMTLPFTDRCVLLTGAGGSIGAALAREIIQHGPRSLVLLDHSEGNLHQIDTELSDVPGGAVRSAILGDIADGTLLAEIFEERKPEIVIHAAAYKHVPLMEWNAIAAVRNNALGTNLLANVARAHGTGTFVMVSTDKAVNPHSVMGASKRVAELALLRWSSVACPMRAVRLGNVVGSQGSVVPRFQLQIARGGPVTVTHPDVNRYFLHMEEAVELVLLAARMDGEGGIYIPDPGKPLRIVDLAKQLIKQAGVVRQDEIPVVMTGLRAGDKMTEEFISKRELVDALNSMNRERLSLIKGPQPADAEFDSAMAALQRNVDQRDLGSVLDGLRWLVPEYQPSDVVLESRKEPQSSSL
jgi:FlaA1/EpsC-like NDP-sugar epimerase